MDTIIQQVKHLINNYITNRVNTGDKIMDVAISVIFLALFDMVIKFCREYFQEYNSVRLGKNPWDFDAQKVKKISTDDVKKYNYSWYFGTLVINSETTPSHSREYFSEIVYDWIVQHHKNVIVLNHSNCDIAHNNKFVKFISNDNIMSLKINSISKTRMLFMPIWAYYDHGQIEFIYLLESTLYSNSVDELNKFMKEIGIFAVNTNKLGEKSDYKPLRIRELLEGEKDYKLNDIGIVNKNKIFNNIFFDEKTNLLQMIEKYETNTMYPVGLGLDNKLGILLYGPPGTGKTGTIFCIANRLQKDILLINSLSIKKTLIVKAINDCKKTHIIVLDEFDHLLKDLECQSEVYSSFSNRFNYEIKTQNKTKAENKDNKNNYEIVNTPLNENSTQHMFDKNDIPNDVFLYKLLDSFGDDDGRIIVATTNNPDLVNPLLLRPGRFDMKLYLTYCSFNMFVDIVRKIFDEIDEYVKLSTNKNKILEVLKLNITPLVLINTAIQSKTLDECLDALSKQKQKYYDKTIQDE